MAKKKSAKKGAKGAQQKDGDEETPDATAVIDPFAEDAAQDEGEAATFVEKNDQELNLVNKKGNKKGNKKKGIFDSTFAEGTAEDEGKTANAQDVAEAAEVGEEGNDDDEAGNELKLVNKKGNKKDKNKNKKKGELEETGENYDAPVIAEGAAEDKGEAVDGNSGGPDDAEVAEVVGNNLDQESENRPVEGALDDHPIVEVLSDDPWSPEKPRTVVDSLEPQQAEALNNEAGSNEWATLIDTQGGQVEVTEDVGAAELLLTGDADLEDAANGMPAAESFQSNEAITPSLDDEVVPFIPAPMPMPELASDPITWYCSGAKVTMPLGDTIDRHTRESIAKSIPSYTPTTWEEYVSEQKKMKVEEQDIRRVMCFFSILKISGDGEGKVQLVSRIFDTTIDLREGDSLIVPAIDLPPKVFKRDYRRRKSRSSSEGVLSNEIVTEGNMHVLAIMSYWVRND